MIQASGRSCSCRTEGMSKGHALRDTLAFIQRNGMDVEQISQTKEQCIISRDNCEDAYILKDYRAGRECSTDSIDDMRGGSRALAQLHNILEKYPLPSDIEVESCMKKLSENVRR